MKRLVADTGPIIHLSEARAVHLLPLIGATIVPPRILPELHAHASALGPGNLPDWLVIETLSPAAQARAQGWERAGLLHGGEAEALALAVEIKPDWFITDDAAARLMAESLGLEAHGSLGVVLWTAANKLIATTEAEAHLAALERSSLWMSPKVRAAARAAMAKVVASR